MLIPKAGGMPAERSHCKMHSFPVPQDETIRASRTYGLLLCVEVAPVIQSDWFLRSISVLREHGILVGVFWNRTSLRGFFWRVKHRFAPQRCSLLQHILFCLEKNLVGPVFQLVYEEGFCWSSFWKTSNSPLIPRSRNLRPAPTTSVAAWSPWIVFIAQKNCGERSSRRSNRSFLIDS